MDFEINRLEMLDAARNAARIAPARAPLDVLNAVHVEGSEESGEIYLTAANFEVSIRQKVKASVRKSGGALIEPKLLVGALAMLEGEFVTFSLANPGVVRITGGRCVYELRCRPEKHYPKPVMPFPEDAVKISGICGLAKRTVFAAAGDMAKPALNCVKVKLMHNAIHAAACDGYRMMLVRHEAESPENQEFLIPSQPLRLLASISDDSDVFEVCEVEKELVFTKGNMMFTVKKIEGTFVDVNTLVKSVVPAFSAVTGAGMMKNALELASVVAGKQPVNLVFRKDGILLGCDDEAGASRSSVSASVAAVTPEKGFYYDLSKLTKLFQVIDGKVKLDIDKNGMMLVKTRNELYLQLPQAKPVAARRKKSDEKRSAA